MDIMDIKEIKETSEWQLYEKGKNFFYMKNIYSNTDRNYRFYNGDQWDGAKLGDIEPVQKNYIKPIVKYKNSVIHDNLYAVHYSSLNHEKREFIPIADKTCEKLNIRASRVWERDKLDFKGRRITKDASINGEGIMYVSWDSKNNDPKNEILKKVDVYYGNENDEEIQEQPYILVRKRMSVLKARQMARDEGISEEEIENIIGDNMTFEESGDESKIELNDMVTVITKMYKEKGTVHFSVATRYLVIKEDKDSGLTLYPLAHLNWEEQEGIARGIGEVEPQIANQIEVNKTEARRVLTVKMQAYPSKVVNVLKVTNPDAIAKVGGIIKTHDKSVEDVHKIVGTLPPAQMSPDVKQLQDDLIQMSRELAGAGEVATGEINPEDASGRAILAVQNASQSNMTEQKIAYKNFVEDIARIWLDMWITYSENGIELEEEIENIQTGEKEYNVEVVPQEVLKELNANTQIDITPKSAYDKYAQEMCIENLFTNGMFNIQKLPELKIYTKLLDSDSTMPKKKLEQAIKFMEEEQRKIAMINMQAQLMQSRANQFLNSDYDVQADQLSNAKQEVLNQNKDIKNIKATEKNTEENINVN